MMQWLFYANYPASIKYRITHQNLPAAQTDRVLHYIKVRQLRNKLSSSPYYDIIKILLLAYISHIIININVCSNWKINSHL